MSPIRESIEVNHTILNGMKNTKLSPIAHVSYSHTHDAHGIRCPNGVGRELPAVMYQASYWHKN